MTIIEDQSRIPSRLETSCAIPNCYPRSITTTARTSYTPHASYRRVCGLNKPGHCSSFHRNQCPRNIPCLLLLLSYINGRRRHPDSTQSTPVVHRHSSTGEDTVRKSTRSEATQTGSNEEAYTARVSRYQPTRTEATQAAVGTLRLYPSNHRATDPAARDEKTATRRTRNRQHGHHNQSHEGAQSLHRA